MAKLPTQYQDLEDVRLAYREHGIGQPLILLHGNSESKSIFSGYQQIHFDGFHTIAIDSRGHGETISNDTRYLNKPETIEDIRSYLLSENPRG